MKNKFLATLLSILTILSIFSLVACNPFDNNDYEHDYEYEHKYDVRDYRTILVILADPGKINEYGETVFRRYYKEDFPEINIYDMQNSFSFGHSRLIINLLEPSRENANAALELLNQREDVLSAFILPYGWDFI